MLETTGLDDRDHLAVIGALGPLKMGAAIAPRWLKTTTAQGVSTPEEELDYLPLDKVDVTAPGGGGTIDVEDRLIANPQRPFRGERVVLTAFLIAAGGGVTDALFSVLIQPAIYVGATQVGATQGSLPAAAFGATAFGVRLSFPSAGQGTRIYIPVFYPGLAAGNRIVIAGGIFGRAVR